MVDNYSGQCTCGGIKFKIETAKANVVNCHCTDCRGLTGAAFTTYLVVSSKRFTLTQGEELLKSYSATGKVTRHFCSNCGTPLFNSNTKYPGLRMVYYGSIDFAEAPVPGTNIFCRSKLLWVEVDEDAANYEAEIRQ